MPIGYLLNDRMFADSGLEEGGMIAYELINREEFNEMHLQDIGKMKIGVDKDYLPYLIGGFSELEFYNGENPEGDDKKRRKTERRINSRLNKKFLN